MKKLLLILSFLFLSGSAFCQDNCELSLKTQGGSLYVDDTDYSYYFDAGCEAKINSTAFGAGLFWGAFSQYDIDFGGGYGSLSFDLPADFGLTAFALTGSAASKQSDLYLLYGRFSLPHFYDFSLLADFPLDFYTALSFAATDLDIFDSNEKAIGEGNAWLFDAFAGKKWQFASKAGKAVYNLDTSLGFFCADGNAWVTASKDSQNNFLLPFSYLHFDGRLWLDFITLSEKLTVTAGHWSFFLDSALFLNVYSYYNWYFKGTYKKNLIYDGSIRREEDTDEFCRVDSLLYVDAGIAYSINPGNSLGAVLSLNKKLLIPLLSKATKSIFSETGSSQSSSDSQNSLLKTLLLSGLTLEIKLNF